VKTAARPPLARILAFDRAVREGRYPNARQVADELEVDPRTIQRDIEFLRDRCGAPLEYDPVRHGYSYRDPTYRLTLTDLTEGELVALLLAERALQTFRGTPYAAELARLFRKIAAFLPEHITIDLEHLAGLPSFRVAAVAEIDPKLFATLARATRESRPLRVRYW
jgi:proteasome accessory factor B